MLNVCVCVVSLSQMLYVKCLCVLSRYLRCYMLNVCVCVVSLSQMLYVKCLCVLYRYLSPEVEIWFILSEMFIYICDCARGTNRGTQYSQLGFTSFYPRRCFHRLSFIKKIDACLPKAFYS